MEQPTKNLTPEQEAEIRAHEKEIREMLAQQAAEAGQKSIEEKPAAQEQGVTESEKVTAEELRELEETQMGAVQPHPEDLAVPTAEGEKAPEGKPQELSPEELELGVREEKEKIRQEKETGQAEKEKAEKEKTPEEIVKELEGLRLEYAQTETAKNKAEKGVKSIGGIRERLGTWFRGEQKTKERKAAVESESEKAQAAFAEIKGKYDKTLKEYTKSLYKKKDAELSSDPDKTKKLKEYAKTELFNETFFNEVTKLNQARMGDLPPREKNWCNKAFSAWKDMPTWQKWALSAGAATGFAFAGGGAATAAMGYFGYRLGRAAVGTIAGRLAGGAYQKYIIEAGRQKTTGEIKAGAEKGVEAAENFESLMQALEAASVEGRQKIAERAKVERWHKLGQAAVIVGTAGLTSWGAGKMMDSYFEAAGLKAPVAEKPKVAGQPAEAEPGAPPISEKDWARGSAMEKAMEPGKYVKLEDLGILKIGARGPEGAIIDHLRANPDLAKSWGWDGKVSINQFAGTKAHTMWSELAKAEIAKPEVQAQLEKLGYSKNMGGYAEMMRRIGKGYVDIDSKSGIMKGFTDDTTFLKAAEVLKKVVPWQIEAPAELSVEQPPIPEATEEVGELNEIVVDKMPPKPPGESLPASAEELERMGYSQEQIADLEERAKLSGKNFVIGSDYENYANRLRESGYFDIVDKDGVIIRPTEAALAARLDETIAGTLGMEPSVYGTLKEMNLEKFVKVKPATLGEHFEWKPAKRVVDAYLKQNKFLDPEDLKGTVGDFFKKTIKIDVGEMPLSSGRVSTSALERLAETPEAPPEFRIPSGPVAPAVEGGQSVRPVMPVEKPEWKFEPPTISSIVEVPGMSVEQKTNTVIEAITEGKFSVDDLGKYYTDKLGVPPFSEYAMFNLKNSLEWMKGTDPAKRIAAEKAIKVMFQKLEAMGK